MPYQKPKSRLHREFLYLDNETVVNSLSALEAGKVDEIIQKINEAREGGFTGALNVPGAEVSGGKKKTGSVEEELVRTRTTFSAFESWYSTLKGSEAFGTFDEWNEDVRDSLSVGDTLEFQAEIELTPIHLLFRTYLAWAAATEQPGSPFQQKGQELSETKATSKKMRAFVEGGVPGSSVYPVYLRPFGVDSPRMIGTLVGEHIVRAKDGIQGEYRVIAQVDQIIDSGFGVPAIRILGDVPPTKLEVDSVKEALENFIEPAKAIGLDITSADLMLPPPVVVVRPIAVYR
jgi:archaellum component FlaC